MYVSSLISHKCDDNQITVLFFHFNIPVLNVITWKNNNYYLIIENFWGIMEANSSHFIWHQHEYLFVESNFGILSWSMKMNLFKPPRSCKKKEAAASVLFTTIPSENSVCFPFNSRNIATHRIEHYWVKWV